MNKLFGEMQRLYLPAGCVATPEMTAAALRDTAGNTRTLWMDFRLGSSWSQLAELWQAVQDELELPAPAVSIAGRAGFRLWFSLAEPISGAQAGAFLAALRRRWLSTLPVGEPDCWPDSGGAAASPAEAALLPAMCPATGRWSAFIDPGMGSLFVDEGGLATAPADERQAQLLAGVRSISPAQFTRALAALGVAGPGERGQNPVAPLAPSQEILAVGGPAGSFADPRAFLLAVMNDAGLPLRERIRAATALLADDRAAAGKAS